MLIPCLALALLVTSVAAAASGSHAKANAAAHPSAARATITLRLGHSAPIGNDEATAATLFAQLVQAKTNGKVKVVVYPNSLLGPETAMLEKLQSGALDMAILSTAVTENQVPKLDVLDLPYLINSYLQANKVFTGKPAAIANAALLKAGLHALGFEYIGFRIVDCKSDVIGPPDYLKGIKIRVPNSPVFITAFQAWGANPDPIAYNDVYTALQTGVVDCWESVGQSILNSKFYEVAKQITMTRHMFGALAMMINQKKFLSLPPDVQTAIVSAANQANAYARRATEKTEGTDFGLLAKLGVQFHQVDTAPMRQIAQGLWQSVAQKADATDLLQAIQAIPAK